MSNVIERVATQAAGAIGALRASVRGLRGVFLRLSEEHRETVALLEQTLAATEYEKRAEAWNNVRNELLAHERAESQQVYAQLTHYPDLEYLVRAHEVEADELELLIARIDALDLNAAEWQSSVDELEQYVRRHAAKEEDELFPAAQDVIGLNRTSEIEGLYTNGRRSILHELKSPTDDDPSDGR